jgi:hypothetical protein
MQIDVTKDAVRRFAELTAAVRVQTEEELDVMLDLFGNLEDDEIINLVAVGNDDDARRVLIAKTLIDALYEGLAIVGHA